MSERFILYYDGTEAAWLNAADELVRGPLADAGSAADGRETVVLLPGEHILATRVQLPPIRQARRRQQAAAYALEDQLVSRVDDLFFALAAKPDADGETPLLVVDREWLETVLADCRTAGLDVLWLTADTLALDRPPADAAWTVAIVGERVLTRTGPVQGFAGETGLWPALASGCAAPERIRLQAVENDPNTAALVDAMAFDPAPEIEYDTAADRDTLEGHILRGADTANTINLRQGAYARRNVTHAWWQPFQITAALAAALLIVIIAGRAIESWQLQSQIDTLSARSESAFRDAFPDVGRINNLQVQAEQNIRALRGDGSADGVFALLQATAQVTRQTDELTIQSMQYRDNTLYLSLRGDSVQSLEALRSGFARHRNTRLNVESADAGADGVQIRASVSATQGAA